MKSADPASLCCPPEKPLLQQSRHHTAPRREVKDMKALRRRLSAVVTTAAPVLYLVLETAGRYRPE